MQECLIVEFLMRNCLYKWIIHDATNYCYSNCLDYFHNNSSILDVGIGNGLMLKTYHPLIKAKGLSIIGLDINKSYLNHCDELIHTYGLYRYIRIRNKPVEIYEPEEETLFDFILFSMSFMLMHDQRQVIDRVKAWLKPNGKIVFFQTFFKGKFRIMEIIKPRLKYITSIDFGMVTYETDFKALLKDKKLKIIEDRLLKQTWFRGEYRMVVTAPIETDSAASKF